MMAADEEEEVTPSSQQALPAEPLIPLRSVYETVRASMAAAAGDPPEPEETSDETSSPVDNVDNCRNPTVVHQRQVQVNQRALIDKILARYASAGALYRELLANSNDANATCAQVHLMTTKNSCKNTNQKVVMVTEIVFRNNGIVFRPEDWNRLQKIAQGNPDPDKIGAFGVGAYCMFSICEEPMVISGGQALLFKWKGDALWTQQMKTAVDIGSVPSAGCVPWTSFHLPLREGQPMTNAKLVELGQFFCSSLTFSDSLAKVNVLVDGENVLEISKRFVPGTSVRLSPRAPEDEAQSTASTAAVAAGDLNTHTANGFLELDEDSITRQLVELDVQFYNQNAQVSAHYVSAIAATHLDASTCAEMQRITQKPPPERVTLQTLQAAVVPPVNDKASNNKSNVSNNTKAVKIARTFANPGTTPGKIFIGFKTSQTTGYAAHICAPFLPTVEREAIDLQHQAAAQFNFDLLECSGKLLRLFLEWTMYNDLGTAFLREQEEARQIEELAEELLQEDDEQVDDEHDHSGHKEIADGTKAQHVVTEYSIWGTLTSTLNELTDELKESLAITTTKGLPNTTADTLLKPNDDKPVSGAERYAVLLMKSLTPRESTPDSQVGETIRKGFTNCLRSRRAPPVLTCQGVVPGSQAKLPSQGFEFFCCRGVVRSAIAQNTFEYHDNVAHCSLLTGNDFLGTLEEKVHTEEELVHLLQWWTRLFKTGACTVNFSVTVRDRFKFSLKGDSSQVHHLKRYKYFLDVREGIGSYLHESIPLPDTVLTKSIRDKVGLGVIKDHAFDGWLFPLPAKQWVTFIRHHSCLSLGEMDENSLQFRIHVLAAMSRFYMSLPGGVDKRSFGLHCRNELSSIKCIPYDEVTRDAVKENAGADKPSAVAIYEATGEWKPRGIVRKVSQAVWRVGVCTEFLKQLGIQHSVQISFDCFIEQLLERSSNAKDIVDFLRVGKLPKLNPEKVRESLASRQYLPAENTDQKYSPSELFLPRPELRMFPFIKLLQWPEEESSLHPSSQDGRFLIALGVRVHPPIHDMVLYVSHLQQDEEKKRLECLDIICEMLRSERKRQQNYMKYDALTVAFLPCKVRHPFSLSGTTESVVMAPRMCYYSQDCAVMGFPIVHKLKYGETFACLANPLPKDVLDRFLSCVDKAKCLLEQNEDGESMDYFSDLVMKEYEYILQYMSTRSLEFDGYDLDALQRMTIIPCKTKLGIAWHTPSRTLRKSTVDTMAGMLFHITELDCPFLRALGVKAEASAEDLYHLVLESPQTVLDRLGNESLYRALLKHIAAAFGKHSRRKLDRDAPFLLAYTTVQNEDGTETTKYKLAKATDIYVIDNSLYGRMFAVARAPYESLLEEFYLDLGSKLISKHVKKKFRIEGTDCDTPVTASLRVVLEEKIPLLLSPAISSRPVVHNAASRLNSDKLEIHQATSIMALCSLNDTGGSAMHRQATTCASKKLTNGKLAIYISEESFDWFDVGHTIGELIYLKCRVEDAFFIGSLLETPLDKLRARGFAVDRILAQAQVETAVEMKREEETIDFETAVEMKREEEPMEEPVLLPVSLTNFVASAACTAQTAASTVSGSSWFGSSVGMLSGIGERTISAETNLAEPLLEQDHDTIDREDK